MPYIKPESRQHLDSAIDKLISEIRNSGGDNADGWLNYTVSRIVSGVLYPAAGEWSYRNIARAVACFECAKLEFYRRVGAAKEGQAILNNGDIPEYEHDV